MFSKFAEFFIKNAKLTSVIVIIVFLSGIISYIKLPKQYNPEIVAPAFNIFLKAPSLSSEDIQKYIISPLENKLMELEGMDEIYSTAGEWYASVLAKFDVGIDKEKAKIRINQKIGENIDLKPFWVSEPFVMSLDPDDLPQITFALYYTWNDLEEEKSLLYLRESANILKEKLKTVKNTSTLEVYGGIKKNIIIDINLDAIKTRNLNITDIYGLLKQKLNSSVAGNIYSKSGEKYGIFVDGTESDKVSLETMILTETPAWQILLGDIAEIRSWVKRITKSSSLADKQWLMPAVFLAIGKRKWTNAVFVVNDIIKELKKIEKELPQDIKIKVIQDEWETAKNATNMLLVNLFQSIFIVFIILSLSLGVKNALNTAVTIPITLFAVFLASIIIGENINRITLFALILVLGMLVDDSTVVVENINRNLEEREKKGKTKLEAILHAIREVELGVILSTLTRLLAFGAMFFVGGMMGEYMGPIPRFAIIASLISTTVALSINPWISYYTEGIGKRKKEKKKKSLGLRKKYLKVLEFFIKWKKSAKRIFYFKLTLWVSLFLVILGPIYGGIFKARMLPKSNQNQIYLWVDAPKWWDNNTMQNISKDISDFLLTEQTGSLAIVDSISFSLGEAFPPDFANLFRGWLGRNGENQLSARINLIPKNTLKNRLTSEAYTIQIRPLLKKVILKKYPDIKFRLLEDPPWPPNQATFLIKVKSDASDEGKMTFFEKVEKVVRIQAPKQNVVDLENSIARANKKLKIIIDHNMLEKLGLSSEQVIQSLQIITYGAEINIIKETSSLEETNIILGSSEEFLNSIDLVKNFSFINTRGEKIYLDSFADIEYSFVENEIFSDNKEETLYLYAEMGDNSLVYPVIELFSLLRNKDFLGEEYKVARWSPYGITYTGLRDGKKYRIEFSWEWETTMDTFRDLGIAMMLSIGAIYLILVGQFTSFSIAWVIMMTFLLGFYGVFSGFSVLYLVQNEYFSATSMIGVIALAGIVVWNAIMMIEYINILKANKASIEDAVLSAAYTRAKPIILTSLTTIFWAMTIIGDPVWSGLARSIICGLLLSSVLTLLVVPIFYYNSQKKFW